MQPDVRPIERIGNSANQTLETAVVLSGDVFRGLLDAGLCLSLSSEGEVQ